MILIVLILGADFREGPKTAYVGVLTAVPLFAAVFGTPAMTAITSVLTWLSAFIFGLIAADGNVPAQRVRLGIIAVAGIVAVIASYLRRRREQQFQRARQAASKAELLRVQASHDDLTGLLNRRGLIERIDAENIDRGTVIVIDCDDFKDVNDTYGHQVGDEFLQGLAGRLSRGISWSDSIARWGGDEFLIMLAVPFEQGAQIAHRVIEEAMARPMSTKAGLIPVSLSAGAAEFNAESGLDKAIGSADRAMYTAKNEGPGKLVLER